MRSIRTTFAKPLQIFVVACIFSLVSCTVQKRIYRKGYTVHSKNQYTTGDSSLGNIETDTNMLNVTDASLRNTAISASLVVLSEKEISVPQDTIPKNSDECDIIVLKNGDKIKVKIQEFTNESIIYKKCDDLNGVSQTILKEDVHLVKIYKKPEENKEQKTTVKKTLDPVAVIGFLLSIIGFILVFTMFSQFSFIGIFGGLLLGIISLIRIKTNSERLKGSGFSLFSIVSGLTFILVLFAFFLL